MGLGALATERARWGTLEDRYFLDALRHYLGWGRPGVAAPPPSPSARASVPGWEGRAAGSLTPWKDREGVCGRVRPSCGDEGCYWPGKLMTCFGARGWGIRVGAGGVPCFLNSASSSPLLPPLPSPSECKAFRNRFSLRFVELELEVATPYRSSPCPEHSRVAQKRRSLETGTTHPSHCPAVGLTTKKQQDVSKWLEA